MKRWLSIFSIAFPLSIFSCTDYQQGKSVYTESCANCHGDKGQGLASLYPSLQKSNILSHHPDQIPCIILKGIKRDSIQHLSLEMPPHPDIKEVDMTNLINYLLTLTRKDAPVVTIDSVTMWMKNCK
ncbi:MAG TPA: cytochrome c [Saprospiraceae bacterium]|jgi:mono/diheme cytochrome c family protein|nr:cytochrome c [Saprospiraceae bacterium]HQU94727.1 cytochrome c [Saprospiraceae bacterium]HQW94212.1 cytochrome c [Saprospiraceae bacterium]